MKLLAQKYILRPYLVISICSLFVLLIDSFLNISPWTILLTVLFFIFFPGFALSRIFKIEFSNDRLGQLILWLALGLIFNLSISFFAILIGLTIIGLFKVYIVALVTLFSLAFVLDLFRPDVPKTDNQSISFEELFKVENLIYCFIFLLVILVLITVNQIGGNFKGDPQYHIAIMRKAIEGWPLTVENLSFVKNQIDLVYGLPVWHVFLTLLTKILKTNIFTFWTEIPTTLTLLVFLVWSWFLTKILPNLQVALLALFLFVAYYFGIDGHLYTRLAVPDTLNQLFLLPLSFALALKYIFDEKSNYKYLIILSLLLFFIGIIHWSQYFYFIFGMGLFGAIYTIFWYREKNFWQTLQKIIYVIFANMILVAPAIIFLEAKSHAVSSELQNFVNINTTFNNDSFMKFNPYVQLSFLFLPLVALFLRSYRRLTFVLAVFLVGILVFNIPYLENFLIKYLSPIFVKRLYTNLGEWPYVIWALVLSFVFVLIDRYVKINNSLRRILNIALLICSALAVFLELKFQAISWFYNRIFSDSLKLWLGDNYYWLISIVVLSILVLFLFQKYHPKLVELFTFQDYRHKTTILALTFLAIFFLSSNSMIGLKNSFNKEISNHRFFSDVSADPVSTIIDINQFGGQDSIDFIKNNIPAKSIFASSGSTNMILPMLLDISASSFNFGQEAIGAYQNIFRADVPIQDRLKSLKKGNIEYILYAYSNYKPSPFTPYPQYFTKIFDNGNAAIYKVKKNELSPTRLEIKYFN